MPIVVAKRTRYPDGRTGVRHCYWCPGCDARHCIAVAEPSIAGVPCWSFTGTLDSPTYSPSQLSRFEGPNGPVVCHTFIRSGLIQFLADSTHALAGRTVPLPPLPDWVGGT